MTKQKRRFLLLAAVYLSFITLGMPDGALGVAWPGIRYEMNLPLGHGQFIFMTHAFVYALIGSLSGRIAERISLGPMNGIGLLLMVAALFGFALSPNFIVFVGMAALLGTGMGLIDSSLNSFMAKYFSSRHMNLLHCFWGLGGAISPIIMSQLILLSSWRTGYVSIALVQTIVAGLVLVTLLRGVWQMDGEQTNEQRLNGQSERPFLTKKRFQYIQMLIFFLYTGTEYSVTFWTTSVLLESRGMDIAIAGLYPAVYLGSIMGGRILFGYLANRLSNTAMIRLGFLLAMVGGLTLIVSSHIIGIALLGLGFAPIFPCLMHETSKRFSPAILTKLVGYQIAAVGTGIAIVSAVVGQILSRVSLEALFPLVALLIVVCFLLNELIEKNMAKN